MHDTDLRLQAAEYEKIQTVLSKLRSQCSATTAVLISRSGQEVAYDGESDGFDRESFAALAASNLAATGGLAQLLGEIEFERVYLKGARSCLLVGPVGEAALLLLVFPNHQKDYSGFVHFHHAVALIKHLLGLNRRLLDTREM